MSDAIEEGATRKVRKAWRKECQDLGEIVGDAIEEGDTAARAAAAVGHPPCHVVRIHAAAASLPAYTPTPSDRTSHSSHVVLTETRDQAQ